MRNNYYKEVLHPGAHASPPFQQKILSNWLKWINGRSKIRTALDVGSGLGFNLPTLSQFSSQVWASDISPAALKENQKNHPNLKNVKYVTYDAQALKFPDDHFDLVVCTEVLEHLQSPEKALKECGRVLKSQGFLILSAPNYFNTTGLIKWWKDQKMGHQFWDPWGAHKEGLEKRVTFAFLHKILPSEFEVIKTQGANFLLAWFYFLPLGKYGDSLPLLWLGRLPILKNLAMQYYILAQKND